MNWKRGLSAVAISVFALFQIEACTKEKVPFPTVNTTCPDTISFSTVISPLISTNCSTSGCHDNAQSGGYNLLSHVQISANADIILKTIRHESGVSAMPLGGSKLADSLAEKFNCWISQGKLNN